MLKISQRKTETTVNVNLSVYALLKKINNIGN